MPTNVKRTGNLMKFRFCATRQSQKSPIESYYYVSHISPFHQRPAIWVAMGSAQGIRINLISNHRRGRLWSRSSRGYRKGILIPVLQIIVACGTLVRSFWLASKISARKNNIPVVICNGGIDSLVLALVLRARRRQVVIDMVDAMLVTKVVSFERVRELFERSTLKLANVAVFVSEEQRRSAVMRHMISQERSVWIPYGITDDALKTSSEVIGRLFSDRFISESAVKRNSEFRIGWFGSLSMHAGVDPNEILTVLRGIELARQAEGIEVKLLLGGVEPNELMAVVQQEPVNLDFVTCGGRFVWGSRQHWETLASCDVLVLPSGKHLVDANRAKLYDYMAVGRPIIARETAEVSRILGSAAKYVDGSPDSWCDAIVNLHATPELRETLGTKSRNRVEELFAASQLSVKLTLVEKLLL